MSKTFSKTRMLALVAASAVAAFVAGGVVPSAAQVTPSPTATTPPPVAPIAVEFLTGRAVFPDDVSLKFKLSTEHGGTDSIQVPDPSRTVVGRYTVQPGAAFPWHTHAGPVVVNVVSGTLVYVPAEDCEHRPYPAGTAFVDPGRGHVHSAFNPGPGVTVFVATFFDAPETDPLLIPADAPADCVV